jgi:hypothetical protein
MLLAPIFVRFALKQVCIEYKCFVILHLFFRRSVGMYAVRARRKIVEEKDFLSAVNKVIKEHAKFSATPKYLIHN